MLDFGKISLKSINKIQHDTGKSFTPDFNAFGIQKKKHCRKLEFSSQSRGVKMTVFRSSHEPCPAHTHAFSYALGSCERQEHWVGNGRCCFVSSEHSWGPRWRLHCTESERHLGLVPCLLLWSLPPPAFHFILTCEWTCAVFRRLTFFSSENQNLLFLFKVIAIYLSHLHFKNFK